VCEDLLYEDQALPHIAMDAYSPSSTNVALIRPDLQWFPASLTRVFAIMACSTVVSTTASTGDVASDDDISHRMCRI
jgi:hypothetical protein